MDISPSGRTAAARASAAARRICQSVRVLRAVCAPAHLGRDGLQGKAVTNFKSGFTSPQVAL